MLEHGHKHLTYTPCTLTKTFLKFVITKPGLVGKLACETDNKAILLLFFLFFVLRWCSSCCLVRLTPYYGSQFLSIVHVPGIPFSRRMSAVFCQVFLGLLTGALQCQHCAWLHIISIILSFNMSMPRQSASSHHIPDCLYTLASSQFNAGLSFFQGDTTHPPDHPHLHPFYLNNNLLKK